jgi:ABC-2 type transport system permease protein
MPFSEWGLVIGKFLASLAVVAIILILTLPMPLSLLPLGTFDGGVILTEYIGALLLGAAAVSIGLFMSALSKILAASFLASAAVLLVIVLVNQLPFTASLPGPVNSFISFVSLTYHFESFSKGLLDTRDLAFFLLTTLLFLYLNAQVILYRKWN